MTNIEALCDSIIAEAEQVKAYSERIEAMLGNGDTKTAQTLDDARIDAVTRLSKVTVGLSAIFYEEEGVNEGNPETK